jgi:predicted PurR-regulated permease PerM
LIDDKRLSTYRVTVFFLVFAFAIGLFTWMIWPFVSTIIMALILVGICRPVYLKLTEVCDGRTWLSSGLICLAILLGIFVPLVFLVSSLSVEVTDFYAYLRKELTMDNLNHYLAAHSATVDRITHLLDRLGISYSLADIQQHVIRLSKSAGLWAYTWTRTLAGQAMSFTLNFIIMLVFIYFMLIDGPRVKEYLMALSPLPRDQEEMLLKKFNDMTMAMIVGNGVAAILQGILGGIGLALFDIRSPVLWGTVMAIFAFIPFIGISVVFIPIGVYLLLAGETSRALTFLVSFQVLSMVSEYYLKPKLVGDRVKIHVLLIFISIFGGLTTFGLLGVLFGPLITIGFLSLVEIYHQNYGKHLL